MNVQDHALSFTCGKESLIGIISMPEVPSQKGVLILVGGPQYRCGSHRQFTLLSRHLASHGIVVLRFDYRGMGDSEGDARTFEEVGDDLHCAINRFFAEVPTMQELVIWGLCDAASAALFYAHQDHRVTGLVLLNPWVRTEAGVAKAYLKHYYVHRLLSRDLWRKVFCGTFSGSAAIASLGRFAVAAVPTCATARAKNRSTLPERMFEGLMRFNGKTLLILSGNDITAQEFSDLVTGSHQWRRLLRTRQVQRREIEQANHTFSSREWRETVAAWTREWVQSW